MSNEDLSKLWGGNGEATNDGVFKAYRWKLFKIDQDTNKTISVWKDMQEVTVLHP